MYSTRRYLIVGVMAAAALAAGVAALAGGSGASAGQGGNMGAIALLHDAAGDAAGHVTFTRQGNAVRVQAEVYGLPPGFHGFHVHAVGVCNAGGSAAFASAGGHFNPDGHDHAHHAGDMPVLYVKEDGTGSLSFLADAFAVADLFDADGSAVIVHANPDNYANIPARYAAAPDATTLATGDAGGRIACGVVESPGARGRR